MKKLFFIALFAIGLTTTVHAQCVSDYNYNADGAFVEFRSSKVRCYIDSGTYTAGIYINYRTPNVYVYAEPLNYMYFVAGLHFYTNTITVGAYQYHYNAGINSSGIIVVYEICRI
ncbi:hypothetical protein Q4Q35_20005 [Flavivirga aquimarina]|uniref:Uncharacterized protein n=1 Tax=Flavivirga aquimarina TaxID=2027862 RepID=A0ABT8WG47_9FLAO|nr:hypothetical protein [Flavivirga aquimarina]MDO5972091.1 hypothetical protein [Flavivirga aquimarina]